jgi:hypothetical protein
VVVFDAKISKEIGSFGADIDKVASVEASVGHHQKVVLPAQIKLEDNFSVTQLQADKISLQETSDQQGNCQ